MSAHTEAARTQLVTVVNNDAGNGWRKYASLHVALMPRTGWPGAWDAFIAALLRRPIRTVPTDVRFSMYVRGNPVRVEMFGACVEKGNLPEIEEDGDE